MMPSSSSIMVHIAPWFSSYGSLFMKIHHLKQCSLSNLNTFDKNIMKLTSAGASVSHGHISSFIIS